MFNDALNLHNLHSLQAITKYTHLYIVSALHIHILNATQTIKAALFYTYYTVTKALIFSTIKIFNQSTILVCVFFTYVPPDFESATDHDMHLLYI
jgi:hypothetical protein